MTNSSFMTHGCGVWTAYDEHEKKKLYINRTSHGCFGWRYNLHETTVFTERNQGLLQRFTSMLWLAQKSFENPGRSHSAAGLQRRVQFRFGSFKGFQLLLPDFRGLHTAYHCNPGVKNKSIYYKRLKLPGIPIPSLSKQLKKILKALCLLLLLKFRNKAHTCY